MSAIRTQSTLLGLTAMCALGCANTSTGNPLTNPGRGEETAGAYAHCQAKSTTELELDEQSALGFSASDVLMQVGTKRTETLTWKPAGSLSYGPESGEQALTVEVTQNGTPRFVDLEPKSSGEGPAIEIGSDCPDILEIPVTLKLQSAGGALDESIETTLSARSKLTSRIYHRLAANEIHGSLEVEGSDGFELDALYVSLAVSQYGITGGITPSLTKSTGDSVSNSPAHALASFGLGACEGGQAVPLDASVADFSAADVLQLLEQGVTSAAKWDSGAETEVALQFETASTHACAVLEPAPFSPPGSDGSVGTLRIQGTVIAKSTDDALDIRFPVTVTARPGENRALEDVSLNGERAGSTGFTAVDTSAYDATSASLNLSVSTAGAWSGDFTLIGFEYADCPAPVPGSNSSPGCEGAERHEAAVLVLQR